jgi:F0F1-type ATP synthase assembly protein I
MARSPSDHRGPPLSVIQSLAIASQFGITLAVSVVLGFFVGQWLDTRFGTGIVFSLIGVLVGLAAAATSTVRIYQGFLKRSATVRSRPHTVDDDDEKDE